MNPINTSSYTEFLAKVREAVINNFHKDSDIKYLINASRDRSREIHQHKAIDCLMAEGYLLENETAFYASFGSNMQELYKKYKVLLARDTDQATKIVVTAVQGFIKYLVCTGTVIEMINLLHDRNKVNKLSGEIEQSVVSIKFSLLDGQQLFINFMPVDAVFSAGNINKALNELTFNFNGDTDMTLLVLPAKLKQILKVV